MYRRFRSEPLGRKEGESRHSINARLFVIDGCRSVAERLLQVRGLKKGVFREQSSAVRVGSEEPTRRTVMRIPRMRGLPPHFPGSTVIRSNELHYGHVPSSRFIQNGSFSFGWVRLISFPAENLAQISHAKFRR